jgi:hypothetical protein
MYTIEFTPLPEPDPLAIEVCLELGYRPRYVADELAQKIAAAVASCGGLPSDEAIRLLAAAGVHIHEHVSGEAADGHMAELLCWSAIQRDRSKGEEGPKWFAGEWRHWLWLIDIPWIRSDAVRFGGDIGCLAPAIRRVLHVSPDFKPYWFARQPQGAPVSELSTKRPPDPVTRPDDPPKPANDPFAHEDVRSSALTACLNEGRTIEQFCENVRVHRSDLNKWKKRRALAKGHSDKQKRIEEALAPYI